MSNLKCTKNEKFNKDFFETLNLFGLKNMYKFMRNTRETGLLVKQLMIINKNAINNMYV